MGYDFRAMEHLLIIHGKNGRAPFIKDIHDSFRDSTFALINCQNKLPNFKIPQKIYFFAIFMSVSAGLLTYPA